MTRRPKAQLARYRSDAAKAQKIAEEANRPGAATSR
jgi:hypothetical protein